MKKIIIIIIIKYFFIYLFTFSSSFLDELFSSVTEPVLFFNSFHASWFNSSKELKSLSWFGGTINGKRRKKNILI